MTHVVAVAVSVAPLSFTAIQTANIDFWFATIFSLFGVFWMAESVMDTIEEYRAKVEALAEGRGDR